MIAAVTFARYHIEPVAFCDLDILDNCYSDGMLRHTVVANVTKFPFSVFAIAVISLSLFNDDKVGA